MQQFRSDDPVASQSNRMDDPFEIADLMLSQARSVASLSQAVRQLGDVSQFMIQKLLERLVASAAAGGSPDPDEEMRRIAEAMTLVMSACEAVRTRLRMSIREIGETAAILDGLPAPPGQRLAPRQAMADDLTVAWKASSDIHGLPGTTHGASAILRER